MNNASSCDASMKNSVLNFPTSRRSEILMVMVRGACEKIKQIIIMERNDIYFYFLPYQPSIIHSVSNSVKKVLKMELSKMII